MANNSKPCGLGLIKWLSLLLFLGFGFIGLLSLGLSGAQIGWPTGYEKTAYVELAFLLVIPWFYIFIFVTLLAEPSKKIWLCVNGFWLLLLFLTIGSYFPYYFWLQSRLQDTDTYTSGFILVFGFPIFFISACLIYFQTAKVKEYFGFNRK